MRFIPGSHRGPVLPHELISADSHGLRIAGATPGRAQAVCELQAGGATVHDGRTIHGSGPNRLGRPRRALVFGFGLAPVRLDRPNHYPWQRPEWSRSLL
jgi:ectoine hydroxylase-related dioxygenase (phytanoyl-CoA dioxygenase family)